MTSGCNLSNGEHNAMQYATRVFRDSFLSFYFALPLSRLPAVFAGKTEPRSRLRELLSGIPGSPNTVGMQLKVTHR